MLDLVGKVIGLLELKLPSPVQRFIKSLSTGQRGRIVRLSDREVWRELQTALEQYDGLIQHSQCNADFSEQANSVNIVRTAFQILAANTLSNPQTTRLHQIKHLSQEWIETLLAAQGSAIGISCSDVVTF